MLLGSPINVMRSEDMFAHKLIALYSRYEKNESLANRDLYDIDFFFSKDIPPNSAIIECRTEKMRIGKMHLGEYLGFLKAFLDKQKAPIQKNILAGIGDLLASEEEKNDLKKHLFSRVIEHIEICLFAEQKP